MGDGHQCEVRSVQCHYAGLSVVRAHLASTPEVATSAHSSYRVAGAARCSLEETEVLEHMRGRGGPDVGYLDPIVLGEQPGVPGDPTLFDQLYGLL